MKLAVLLVGCGNIAGRLDAGCRSGDWPRTHAGAYTQDGRFALAACVDPDASRRGEFMRAWDVGEGFGSIEDVAARESRFDVVSICSPTPCHARDLRTVLRLRPRLIFCEKPLARDATEAQALVHECAMAGVALSVNYTRRWDPSVAELKAGIHDGRWGTLRSVAGWYNKGLLNNGSHMIDLLLLLLGPLRVIHAGPPVADFTPEDPSRPVWLEDRRGTQVMLACAHAADFAMFELQLVFARAVVSMEEGGLSWRERPVADSAHFPGYRTAGEGTRRPGGYTQAMRRSVDNLFGALERGEKLGSTGETALAAQRLCEEISRT